jgi:hypothetical protein
MPVISRHQCLVYQRSPALQLQSIAAVIQQQLDLNIRCIYLNSRSMIVGLRSYLFAAGADVTNEIANGRLVLTSDTSHLADGHFNVDRMLTLLETSLGQALSGGYRGLWASGDISREFGAERDFSQLLECEWRLEEFLQSHPALSGICQYHADTLPRKALRQGLLTHSSLFVNETLSRINPHFSDRSSLSPQSCNAAALNTMINDLCSGNTNVASSH